MPSQRARIKKMPALVGVVGSGLGSVGVSVESSRLVRNYGWNLLGQLAPLVAAAVALPLLVRSLGVDRFGVLTISWVIIGYFSLFDLGIGRALTQVVASHVGAGQGSQVAPVVWTSLLLMTALGLAGAILLAGVTPFVVDSVLRIPQAIRLETVNSFYVLALGVPVVLVSTGLRGLLEGYQRFRTVNVVRLPLGVLTYLGPLTVTPFTKSLTVIVLTLLVARIAGLVTYAVLCLRIAPHLRGAPQFSRSRLGQVLRMGGWITVSNVVSPLMSYLDRFLVGSFISVAAVAYYATPNEIVTRILIVPSALVGVMFPAFAATQTSSKVVNASLYDRGLRFLFLLFFPASLMVIYLAEPALTLVFGKSFAVQSAIALQWLGLGMFFNALATVPFGFIQGIGRSDLTAKIHLVELPLYVVLLLALMPRFGIEGVAVAWAARTGIDALALTVVGGALFGNAYAVSRRATSFMILSTAVLIVFTIATPLRSGAALAAILIGFSCVSSLVVLSDGERALARQIGRQLLPFRHRL